VKLQMIISTVLLIAVCGCMNDSIECRPAEIDQITARCVASLEGKTADTVIALIKDSATSISVSWEPPGYMHSMSVQYRDGYSLHLLFDTIAHQPRYSERQECDTALLLKEKVALISVTRGLEVVIGRRIN